MDKEQTIKMEVEVLLGKMGLTPEVSVAIDSETYVVQLKTDTDAPFLIGKYGETLSSIQRVLEAMLFKLFKEPVNLLVNVNDYRERQKVRLEGIAENIANRVVSEQKPVTLRSFSAYERKVIHEYISKNYPQLKSFSEGEGRDRRLNVAPKDEAAGS